MKLKYERQWEAIDKICSEEYEKQTVNFVTVDKYINWKITPTFEYAYAKIIEHNKEYYSFRELLKTFWCFVLHKPKYEYLKAEWISDENNA